MIQAPTLVPPNAARPFVIETDASDLVLALFFCKEVTMVNCTPLAFESKKLSSAERNYPAQERELLEYPHALRSWRCFIEGVALTRCIRIIIHSKYFRSQRKPTPRLTRWIAEMGI
ncbi:hypothetical protein O0I10_002015 [Lichtheimia ornata]|uniref:Reverse transcriptase/retrotransposon-derived protein RNase H-like domain-containing protein n=1 Tax=Lichtheimia ornata TaxID=688661 RepID=A0AAD7VD77_9FUNG|nr:uncharacterized protein O0I10_002015 [Lichtheimia ornata]KAJ8662321.1 hypothetical protein O0I10_002015 [Lichtheimia ornata]